ncbi:serine carboxypeptidase [Colletotrichum camelliae]|nr:serine carboxypeptidase [Colletotrichum camelliae]
MVKLLQLLLLPFCAAVAAAADQPPSAASSFKSRVDYFENARAAAGQRQASFVDRASNAPRSTSYLTNKTIPFAVNGTGVPLVDWDIGESYAGLLPISQNASETRKLFFWFFPSENPASTDEIAESRTYGPTKNPYAWNKLTNFVWIDQPVKTGYSTGEPDILNEDDLVREFKGFWRNFMDTFDLHDRKIYLTGESYAGFYVPYISDGFLKENDTEYFNIKGIAINDPFIGNAQFQQEIILPDFIEYWNNVLGLNDTFMSSLRSQKQQCGYADFLDKHLAFPPPPRPWDAVPSDCGVYFDFIDAVLEVNPCFNVYHITDMCPFPYQPLGVINGGDYVPPSAPESYFNRADVKKALNVPNAAYWWACSLSGGFLGDDRSPGPAVDDTLTRVIDGLNNTIIGSGALDFILPTNGTLLALQNITWNGAQGFQQRPSTPFFVPYHAEQNRGAMAGAGNLGVWGYERGVTFYEIQLAGHELPGWSAGSGYRSLELLLGRIKDFSDTTPLAL